MNARQPALDHLPQVPKQVPAVHDLGRARRAEAGAAGILGGPVPRDHADRVVLAEPCRQGLRRAIRQQVDDMVLLQVDQDGAVGLPFPARPIVNTQDPRRGADWKGNGAHEPENGVGTDGHAQEPHQASTGFPAAGDADPPLGSGKPPCPSCFRRQQIRYGFGKGQASAGRVPAIEPADAEKQANLAAQAWQIGRMTLVSAVDRLAGSAAVGADRLVPYTLG